ncbi:PAPA-1-like conserved region protein [Talaromyces stipitatus ATCC 10500]|uniref:PAPA-1-like conserved region protein n=1 Tax=Talaromyces stipitatus (strain ATCC 10500 / CBS 375.48 / QM 6759 / NRRL 1006) TaxID=441959 RepID=B8LZK1_TALSN|nr:PAPA-1-like conserved region protein [Talaromyces stipitatus ATCC 10500]EED22424.1 PAPA-1-like conserved region protein [Talaromyces stipitatus ATCC 10500]
MPSTRSLRSHAASGSSPDGQDANISTRSGRLTRGAAAATINPATSVTVSRSTGASPGAKSIHLTVKMSSSKLRQVTNHRSSRATASTSSRHNIFTEDPVVHGKRSSRNNRNLKEISEDEEDDDLVEEDDEDVEEEAGDSEDAAGEEDELDADGDLDMDDETPQPAVSRRNQRQQPATKSKPVKPVEEKEMELADDDDENEELSELESDAEGEPDDTMLQDEEMGEAGEEEEEVDEEDEVIEEEEDDGLGSDDDSALDLTKLTKRQRGSLGTDFLQLPMEPQVKKHLTAEEHAMRRAEMARRRKNLSEKRNEEEKMDTINRLLKKQAPKRRGRVPVGELGGEATPDVAVEPEKPDVTVVRWISTSEGCRVAVPTEMLGTPASHPFGGLAVGAASGNKLIEEV